MLNPEKVYAKIPTGTPLAISEIAKLVPTGDAAVPRESREHFDAVRKALASLVESGKVKRTGEKRGTRYQAGK